MKKGTHKQIRKAAIVLFWLLFWQAAAMWMDNQILLVGPLQVARALAENIVRPDFFAVIAGSFMRIGLGFLAAFLTGLLLGAASYRFPFVEELFAPVMAALKSIPVASFVVLLLIWFGSGRLSFWISFLIVFPNVYVNTVAGLRSADGKQLEMARVFGICRSRKFFYIYRPALMPYLDSCLRVCLGMSWKSGVAAEIIGLPEHSLGERLYMSKIYLDTAGLFAWTVMILLLSFLFEKAVLWALRGFAEWKPYPVSMAGNNKRIVNQRTKRTAKRSAARTWAASPGENGAGEVVRDAVQLAHIGKRYGEEQVLWDFTLTVQAGGRYALTAPSGTGKTTLLRIMAGLEQADEGRVAGMPERIGMVFQEDRLCEEFDAVCNIMLCMDTKASQGMGPTESIQWIKDQASRILPADCLTKPVRNLSGGMRRRVALLRAVLSGADVLLLDEPFTGLDEENRMRSVEYLMENLCGRTLVVTTHRAEDAETLKGSRVTLSQ